VAVAVDSTMRATLERVELHQMVVVLVVEFTLMVVRQ
jgi:hypothetical protein